jgi:hypothetical protein
MDEYDRLKAQKDAMLAKEAIRICGNLCEALHKQHAEEYAAAIAALVGALRDRGRHSEGCDKYASYGAKPCTCGLDALVAKYTQGAE